MTQPATFTVEQRDDTLIITPTTDLNELSFENLDRDGKELLELTERNEQLRHAVVDFAHTDYFGSTALSLFVRVWKRLRERDGHLAVCNLSKNEREILVLTRFDTIWTISATLEDALRDVRGR